MIPPAVLEQGERAFVSVLRRRYPDAAFDVRDIGDRSIEPVDADVSGEVGARTTTDHDLIDETAENVTTLPTIESGPEINQRASNGDARDAA